MRIWPMPMGLDNGIAAPTDRGLLPVNWRDAPSALIPASLYTSPSSAYAADPRHILSSIVKKYHELGWRPVCAVEFEFSLYDLNRADGCGVIKPAGGNSAQVNRLYSVNELERYKDLLEDIYTACEDFGIRSDCAFKEGGAGQVEINLIHSDDPVQVADDAHYFKYIVRDVARKHGLGATFMAKPFGDEAGNGLHVHMSLLDDKGVNVFNNGAESGSEILKYAIAGLLDTMRANTLVFAPHLNSYKRFQAETHAPIQLAWGYDNRTTAIRIPSSDNSNRRLEHRVSGADANPYLVLSAVLDGALNGIKNRIEPPNPIDGNAYAVTGDTLPRSWAEATALFQQDESTKATFGELFHCMFLACKRQELEKFANLISQHEYDLYLDQI